MMDLHNPNIVTDGGPWASHDHACSVCHEKHSVLNLSSGVFEPCWDCQALGYETRRKKLWFKGVKK